MAEYYRELVKLLNAHGFHFVRAGKGSHEIWFSPITNRKFTVPKSTKSRHTANDILKEAGLDTAF